MKYKLRFVDIYEAPFCVGQQRYQSFEDTENLSKMNVIGLFSASAIRDSVTLVQRNCCRQTVQHIW